MAKLFDPFLTKCGKVLDSMIEAISLTAYVVAIAVVIFGCGILYTLLTPYSQGIAKGDEPLESCTYFEGVYFSVVTLSSLGYGELHPIGASRAIACIEVLFGLAWLGIVIAKITSRRLSYHVQRLFSSDAQRRLADFIAAFETADQSLRNMHDDIKTTLGKEHREEDQSRILTAFRTIAGSLHTASVALADYISYEAQHVGYFTVAPTDPIRQLEKIVGDVLWRLSGIVGDITPGERVEFLEFDNWKRLAETLDSHKVVCSAIREQSADRELERLTERVLECCDSLRKNYFAAPAAVPTPAQRRQAPPDANPPQEFVDSGE